MHFLMVFGAVLSLFAVCHGAQNGQECSTLSTVYYGVPVGTTVTETVGFLMPTSFPKAVSVSQPTSFPHASAIPQAIGSPLVELEPGVYFFTVGNGTTQWLGGQTPPPVQSYVIETSTVVIEPIPNSTSLLSTGASDSSSTTTIESTGISTEGLTGTLTEFSTSTAGRVNSPSIVSIGSYGWNGTTLHRVKHTGKWSGSIGSSAYGIGISGVAATHFMQHSSSSTPTPLGHQHRYKYARQLGEMVTATMNDVVVSWTNIYDGPVASTPPSSSLTPSSNSIEVSISESVAALVSSLTAEAISVFTPNEESSLLPVATSAASTESSSVEQTVTSTATIVSTIVTVTNIPIHSSGPSPVGSTTSSLSNTAIPSSIGPFLNATMSSSGPTAPTDCGLSNTDVAGFEITFDDLPIFSAYTGETDWPPISSPYYNLYWASGFAYAPLPGDPYVPVSLPYLAVFNANASVNSVTDDNPPNPAEVVQGEIGTGQRFANSSFWFNVYSAYVGCTNAGPLECTITANGFAYEPQFGNVVPIARQTFTQPPCPSQTDCPLLYIELNDNFLGLTDFQLIGSLGDSPVSNTWYMDNLSLGWNDTSCSAANIRAAQSYDRK